jgi:hypothetical protein
MDVRVNLIEYIYIYIYIYIYMINYCDRNTKPGIFAFFIHIFKPYYHLTKISKSLSAKFASQKGRQTSRESYSSCYNGVNFEEMAKQDLPFNFFPIDFVCPVVGGCQFYFGDSLSF